MFTTQRIHNSYDGLQSIIYKFLTVELSIWYQIEINQSRYIYDEYFLADLL